MGPIVIEFQRPNSNTVLELPEFFKDWYQDPVDNCLYFKFEDEDTSKAIDFVGEAKRNEKICFTRGFQNVWIHANEFKDKGDFFKIYRKP